MQNESSYKELNAEKSVIELLREKDREIEKLRHMLVQANKRQFGKKSEKLSTDEFQGLLFEFEEVPAPEVEKEIEVRSYKRTTKNRSESSSELPADEVIEYEPQECYCHCGKKLTVLGKEDPIRELDYVPARYRRIDHVKVKKACASCRDRVYTGQLPPSVQPLERSRPGAGLLSHIIVSKYVDHMPLHRQEEILKRDGIALSRQRMSDWCAKVFELLVPLYESLWKDILNEPYIQADETSIKVQDSSKKGTLHTGYLWGALSPPSKIGCFHYAQSRAGEVPKELFKGFKGVIQTDAYAGYNPVFLPDEVSRMACMAHIRRRFIALQKTYSTEANAIVALMAKLYAVEKETRLLSALERKQIRRKKAMPYLVKLYRYIRALRKTTLPKSLLRGALDYAWSQRHPMLQYLRDGIFEIDNNLIENQMRPVALGRKNWLFAGSHDGASRTALFYSLLDTCRLNKVNPYEWLRFVLQNIHSHPASRINELLPQNWKTV